MSNETFWIFIKNNIISLILVIVGIIALILQSLGLFSINAIANTTLALLALLATSEIVERQQRLSNLENSIKELKEIITNSFDKLIVKELFPDDAAEYLRYLITSAKESIIWVSTEPRRGTRPDAKRAYEDAIDSVAKKGKVRINWISTFDGTARAERAMNFIFKYTDNKKLFIGKLKDTSGNLPLFTFLIFDEHTLWTRPPYSEGGRIKYMVINSPSVISLFLKYYDKLIEHCERLEATKETRQFLATMQKK